ncbi:MAG: GGDEF domain-containing protein [Gammaproteobacteria bacterium]
MMRSLYLLVSLALSAPAHAATTSLLTGPVIGSGAVALICLALVTKFWLERQELVDAHTDLQERFAQSERTVGQLQVTRGELERTIESKEQAVTEIEEQRQQTSEMLVALRAQVERVARIDGHTGIANLQHFTETLGEEIKRSVRQRRPLTLLFGELDFFPDYIDIHGEDRSDFVLQTVATGVSDTFRRAGDMVARVGPSRFAVILPESDQRTGERFAEKLRRAVYDLCIPFVGSDAADRVTISVGLTTVPPTRVHDRSEVVARAEKALQHAQANGFNQVALAANAA